MICLLLLPPETRERHAPPSPREKMKTPLHCTQAPEAWLLASPDSELPRSAYLLGYKKQQVGRAAHCAGFSQLWSQHLKNSGVLKGHLLQ